MPNRLARETSPYLLQHAHNPVDWYPWGPEALERAREEDRPILLSIGYSACHWCHVMERESFEDPETAALMNGAFVNVKVDREERPDLDAVYMRAVQAVTGQGGWPLTVFLTPGAVPYYGGTYFPPEPRHGMPSFRQVLQATRDAWTQRREEITRSADELLGALRRAAAGGEKGAEDQVPEWPLVELAVRSLSDRFDDRHGGFGSAPKFPQAPTLEFLLRAHRLVGPDAGEQAVEVGRDATRMAVRTLREMARGGIRDHLGGGFHRYSVDARWLVPHFEKMLYDNALLARLYVQAWQVDGGADLREAAESTLDWLLDDMRDPRGGFYAARDADSEGEEGRFYVWTPEELEAVLGEDEARLFGSVYGVTGAGHLEGRSILHLPRDPGDVARDGGLDPRALAERMEEDRRRLLEARTRREAPLRDEKVLSGWNGMALRAFAEAGGALDRDDYLRAAEDGLDFVMEAMRRDGRLHRAWTDGEARVPAFLEDYAAVGNALLTTWEATLDPRWLPEIRWACREVLERFWEEDEGVFYDTDRDAEALVVRPREPMDNATPSGTSLAVELLLRAGRLLGEEGWTGPARQVLAQEARTAERFPSAFGRLLSQVVAWHEPPVEVAIVGPRDAEDTRALHRTVLRRYLPGRTLAGVEPGETLPFSVPLLEGRTALEGRPTAYLCRNLACREPVTTAGALDRQLQEL